MPEGSASRMDESRCKARLRKALEPESLDLRRSSLLVESRGTSKVTWSVSVVASTTPAEVSSSSSLSSGIKDVAELNEPCLESSVITSGEVNELEVT